MNNTTNQNTQLPQTDKHRLMDLLLEKQEANGHISKETVNAIADNIGISASDVEQTKSFYHFVTDQPNGKYNIYLNNSVISHLKGYHKVLAAFEKAIGCKCGNVTKDKQFGLFTTACIGMSDQEPAALVNNKVFTRLTPYKATELIENLRAGKSLDECVTQGLGDGNNQSALIHSVVDNNIMRKGYLLSDVYENGKILNSLKHQTPESIIETVKRSGLRGRGGAGFPTGIKWDLCRRVTEKEKYIFCNADEGEPGTFKDRVLLTEYFELLLEGMLIAAFAVGAQEGIIYLRYEYKYLMPFLQHKLDQARTAQWLGKDIAGIAGFDFDMRIQLGAGAYVCGEETALLESAEGKRGEPRDKPPFPVEKGYLGKPTVINNVETFCAVVRILEKGDEWHRHQGTQESSGTKLLSISGDCEFPGIYELPWGFSIYDILAMANAAEDVIAVQVGGPSGALLAPNEFNRKLGYEDLGTGGSIMIFNSTRDILKDVVSNFLDFFIDESCGACSTCRIVPIHLRNTLVRIINGNGIMKDIQALNEWATILKASRCGLGQSAPNPIIYSIKNFSHLYEQKVSKHSEFHSSFNLDDAVKEYNIHSGRY